MRHPLVSTSAGFVIGGVVFSVFKPKWVYAVTNDAVAAAATTTLTATAVIDPPVPSNGRIARASLTGTSGPLLLPSLD